MWTSTRCVWLSVLAAGLATLTSLAGILHSTETYRRETRAWAVQAVGQDLANLLVIALLLGSAVLVRRGSLRALLVWTGCLFYFVYAFAIYAFAVHFNAYFLAYVAVLGFSSWALLGTFSGLRVVEAAVPLRDHPRRGGAGILLVVIGVLFGALWLAEIVPHTLAGTTPSGLTETGLWTNPVHVLDLALLLPAMIVTGVWLRRQRPWGLLLAVPMLVFAVTMGIGILVLFTLMAAEGLAVTAPAAAVVGGIVVASAIFATLLLRGPGWSIR